MQYRVLGRTGMRVSTVSLGAWEIGGAVELTFPKLGRIAHGWGRTDDNASLQLIRRCHEAGVNFVDTAPIYGNGHSEEVIGRALRGSRDAWYICTKGGHGATDGNAWSDFSKARLLSQIDESLRRLQTDHVDVYLLHGPTPEDIGRGECLDALSQIRQQGKTRFVGVSIGPNDMGVALIRRGVVDVLQQSISITDPGACTQLLPAAAEHNVGIVARGLFGAGFLTGVVDSATTFPPDDRRSWQGADYKTVMTARATTLRDLTGPRRSLAQLAVQYVLQLKGVSTIIPGTSKWPHMAEDIAALDAAPLVPDDLARIVALQESWKTRP